MTSLLASLGTSFLAGLFAPIAAVCVLPLYPGFLAYLAGQLSGRESKRTILSLGLITTSGVIVSMTLFGFIFTKLLQESLTKAIGIISPIAFGLLALISILLIFNVDIGRILPKVHAPIYKNPYLTSFLFGFFFGAIVLPCNPAALIVLFAVSTTISSFLGNLLNFIVFGFGMGFPLLLFSIISSAKSVEVINFLTKRKKIINLIAGTIMLAISLYYIIFVFKIFN